MTRSSTEPKPGVRRSAFEGRMAEADEADLCKLGDETRLLLLSSAINIDRL